jgi:hypothetical protein
MEDPVPALLGRLDAIAASLARSEHALALIGLGSVGTDLDRLDAYSDLDFFAIVERDHKDAFIADLTWLEEVAPIVFSFQNTREGHKVLFEDGIYAEFAVFYPEELATIPFAGARIVWRAEGTDLPGLEMQVPTPLVPHATEWLLGEILTNLYVGLTRLRRGERLSAARFIQGNAVDWVLQLCPLVEPALPAAVDPFDGARRFEQRFPQAALHLPRFVQGYDHSVESALAILEFLERHYPLNAAVKQQVLAAAQAVIADE